MWCAGAVQQPYVAAHPSPSQLPGFEFVEGDFTWTRGKLLKYVPGFNFKTATQQKGGEAKPKTK